MTSLALMARVSKRSSERKANIRPIAMLATSSPSLRGAAVASFAVIGRMSMMLSFLGHHGKPVREIARSYAVSHSTISRLG